MNLQVEPSEEIHENRDNLGKYKEVNEVVLAVRKAWEGGGLFHGLRFRCTGLFKGQDFEA